MSTKSRVIAVLVGVVLIGAPMARAGVLPGPLRHYDSVRAHGTDRYQVTCEGGEQAIVMVRGDGDTDLDLVVRDENGHVVCLDCDLTDICVVRWTPQRTGTFTIDVINHGAVYNNYALLTN